MTLTQMSDGRAGGVGSFIDCTDPSNPTLVKRKNEFDPPVDFPEWRLFEESDSAYVCRVLLCPEENGEFEAVALNLPGVASHGETEQQALANVSKEFCKAVAIYLDDGNGIPWKAIEMDCPKGSFEQCFLVELPPEDSEERLALLTPSKDELRKLAKQFPPPDAWLEGDEEKPF